MAPHRALAVLVTAVAYVAALVLTAGVTLVVVIVVAGPHAGMLPSFIEPVVLGLGWLIVLIVPIVIARKVWGRFVGRSVGLPQG